MNHKHVQSKKYYRYVKKSDLIWIRLSLAAYAMTFEIDSPTRKELERLEKQIGEMSWK